MCIRDRSTASSGCTRGPSWRAGCSLPIQRLLQEVPPRHQPRGLPPAVIRDEALVVDAVAAEVGALDAAVPEGLHGELLKRPVDRPADEAEAPDGLEHASDVAALERVAALRV